MTTQDAASPMLKPCPFCGHVGLTFSEGSTFRWRIAECSKCGATTGEERIQTTGEGRAEEWEANVRERLIAAWNTRKPASPAIAFGEVAYVVEWGAISLPMGDPSRITCMEVHRTFSEASAAAEACGFDARVFPITIPDPLREPTNTGGSNG